MVETGSSKKITLRGDGKGGNVGYVLQYLESAFTHDVRETCEELIVLRYLVQALVAGDATISDRELRAIARQCIGALKGHIAAIEECAGFVDVTESVTVSNGHGGPSGPTHEDNGNDSPDDRLAEGNRLFGE